MSTKIDIQKDNKIKICNKCKEEKPIAEFHRDITTKDGYRGSCKGCTNKNKKNSLIDVPSFPQKNKEKEVKELNKSSVVLSDTEDSIKIPRIELKLESKIIEGGGTVIDLKDLPVITENKAEESFKGNKLEIEQKEIITLNSNVIKESQKIADTKVFEDKSFLTEVTEENPYTGFKLVEQSEMTPIEEQVEELHKIALEEFRTKKKPPLPPREKKKSTREKRERVRKYQSPGVSLSKEGLTDDEYKAKLKEYKREHYLQNKEAFQKYYQDLKIKKMKDDTSK